MYTIIISAIIALVSFVAFVALEWSLWGWSILWAVLVFAASMAGIGWYLKRKLAALMAELQRMMLEGRDTIQRKMNEYQRRPVGDPKAAMAQLEKMQRVQIENGLKFMDNIEPFKKWTPLLSRQINTTKMQFHYQLKEFKAVDALMPACIMFDALSGAMMISRMYVNKVPMEQIEKAFKKVTGRLRYNQSALLYSLMSWIYVRNNDEANAHKTLVKACESNENDTLKKNRDRLANGKMKEFSNANFGDEWYALYLEEPKMRVERRMPRADGRPF